MTSSRARVSAIIPCYNSARFLGEALESVVKQSRQPDEIIVVDDGSTDGSAVLARSFGDRVHVIQQERKGPSTARNRGILAANGDCVAFLDADDRWELQKVERQVEAMEDAPNCVCVFTDTYFFDSNRRWPSPRNRDNSGVDFRVEMLRDGGCNASNALCRTDFARRVLFPENENCSEDLLFFLGMREYGPFARIPELLTGYRRSATQSTADPRFSVRSVQARFRWFQHHHDQYSPDESKRASKVLLDDLIVAHDIAYWSRDNQLVRKCRQLFYELAPKGTERPPSFAWTLLPRFAMKVKDALDGVIRIPR